MEMIRFTAYRRDMDSRETHNENQKNPESEPQYEGVVFSDGTCVLRWLTPMRSHSVWPDFKTAMAVHGHPEYGTEIVVHDTDLFQGTVIKAKWAEICRAALREGEKG